MLDVAAEHGIAAEVRVTPAQQVNEASDEMVANDLRFRFVIDNNTLDADGGGAAALPASQ